jgi:hypothetical protein
MAEGMDALHEHYFVMVDGLGQRCWRCGFSSSAQAHSLVGAELVDGADLTQLARR